MVEIDPTRVRCGSQQTRQVVGLQSAIERAEQHADESLSAAQLTTHTSDEVIGERLGDSLAESAVVTAEARDLAASHRVENARRPSARGAAGHLHGAEYARFVRDIAGVVRRGERWLSSDATGIEDAVRSVVAEAEHLGSFDEERSLLRKEGLERGEIDHCRIDLDLSEVGIHRRIERETARQAVLEVRPRVDVVLAVVAERVSEAIDVLGFRHDVWHELETLAGREASEVRDVPVAGRTAGLARGRIRP